MVDTSQISRDRLVLDQTVAQDSLNPVSSDAVYKAIHGENHLPDQTGHKGEFLTTDGNNDTISEWKSIYYHYYAISDTPPTGVIPQNSKYYNTVDKKEYTYIDTWVNPIDAPIGRIFVDDSTKYIYENKNGTFVQIGGSKVSGETIPDPEYFTLTGVAGQVLQLNANAPNVKKCIDIWIGNTHQDPEVWTYDPINKRITLTYAYPDVTEPNSVLVEYKSGVSLDTPQGLLTNNQITNCILEAPANFITYSGNTITVKAGTRVLFANGRNPDGTLKNDELVLNVDNIKTRTGGAFTGLDLFMDKNLGIFIPSNYIESDLQPVNPSNTYLWYNPITNIMKYYNSTTKLWVTGEFIKLAKNVSFNGTVFTSLVPCLPIDIIKRSDIEDVLKNNKLSNCILEAPNGVCEILPFDVVGTPTNTNGVWSNFSASNYLVSKQAFNPGTQPWEIVVKATFGAPSSTGNMRIVGNIGISRLTPCINWVAGSKKIDFFISPDGVDADTVNLNSINAFSQGQTTYIKAEFTGTSYNLYTSIDGQTWTLESTKTSTLIQYQTSQSTFSIGEGYVALDGWTGSIDVSSIRIKVADTLWLKGNELNPKHVKTNKGVKLLFADGRNSDGSLRNLQYTTGNDFTTAELAGNARYIGLYQSTGSMGWYPAHSVFYATESTKPTYVVSSSQYYACYAEDSNIWYRTFGSTTPNWQPMKLCPVCEFTTNDGNINIFKSYQPLRIATVDELTLLSSDLFLSNCKKMTNTIVKAPFGFLTYSGLTVNLVKEIEVQMPSGRNTYSNPASVNVTANNLSVTVATNDTWLIRILVDGSLGFFRKTNVLYVERYVDIPTVVANTQAWLCYAADRNLWYSSSSGSTSKTWTQDTQFVLIGECVTNGTAITSLIEYKPSVLLTDSDIERITNWSSPSNKTINLTLGATGTFYTAPADGWFTVNKTAGITGGYLRIYSDSNGLSYETYPTNAAFNSCISLPVNKGTQIRINYTLTGATTLFAFIYANGAK